MMRYGLLAVASVVALAANAPANAAPLVVGGNLLSTSNADFIGSAISPAPLTFTLVYDYKSGDSTAAFHAAADAFSGTVTVVKGGGGGAYLFGGYNPLSWAGANTYKDANAAFLFSLDKHTILQSGGGVGGDTPYEVYTSASYWPTFGGGHDLFLGSGTSNSGYSYMGYSYAAPPGTVGTDANARSYLAGSYGFNWSEMEVYAVTAGSAVPEPATWAMMLFGFSGLGYAMRGRQKVGTRVRFA